MLIPLPSAAGDPVKNPYRLTLAQAQPVFDIALDDVYDQRLVAVDSIRLHYRDTQLSDSVGPNLAVAMLCNGTLDVIIGFAYVYALAPVARMSATWTRTIEIGDFKHSAVGVPVLTTIGQVRTLSSRLEYRLLTRMSGTYTVLSAVVHQLFTENKWLNHAYIFHDKTAGGQAGGSSSGDDAGGFGDCFFQMDAIKQQLQVERPMVHNYFIFDENNTDQRSKVRQYLIDLSMISNGESKKAIGVKAD